MGGRGGEGRGGQGAAPAGYDPEPGDFSSVVEDAEDAWEDAVRAPLPSKASCAGIWTDSMHTPAGGREGDRRW